MFSVNHGSVFSAKNNLKANINEIDNNVKPTDGKLSLCVSNRFSGQVQL